MHVRVAVSLLVGAWLGSQGALAADEWWVMRDPASEVCRVQRADEKPRVGDRWRGPFPSSAAATSAMCNPFVCETVEPRSACKKTCPLVMLPNYFPVRVPCPSPPKAHASPPKDGGPEKGFVSVDVLYGTDRKPGDGASPETAYGSARSASLHFGRCVVTIPRDHRMGELESPSWLRLEFTPDPNKHIVLSKVSEFAAADFDGALRTLLQRSSTKQVLVFIHGYNVTFADAARRTAQLAYDLGQDVPVLYTWPSAGKVTAYPADEATAEWTVPHLTSFLERVSAVTGGQRINVIAHSMGNRALVRALVELGTAHPEVKLANLILTAPDIDRDTFMNLVPRFDRLAAHSTVYVSDRDEALIASRRFHEAPRAGQSGAELVLSDAFDTVDATAVETDFLGHSYYGDSRTVLSDLFYLLRQGMTPVQRTGLERVVTDRGSYWRIRP